MRKFNRLSAHRKSLLRNLAKSLAKHKKIITTLNRAKDLRSFFEPLVTIGKSKTLHNRRLLFQKLGNDNEVANNLFSIGESNLNRPGGYIRILRCGMRNDHSIKALVEIIDKPENSDVKSSEK